ncbi:MAG: LacI family transcriptional regulator [Anaerolineae bacterium]|nr:LacI family transcriptional regulator [Anaerolineae bacterium]
MVTIKDVARLANVSAATVSHVINKTRKVNPETIARVEAAISSLGYRLNSQARSLKTGSSLLIGVITFATYDPFFSEVLAGIERTAYAAGYGVMLRHAEFNLQAQIDSINLLMGNNIDGLIVNSTTITPEFYELIKQIDRPCLFLEFYDPALPVDSLESNNFAAAYQSTLHLLKQGHRRIGCIGGCAYEQVSVSQRRKGYEKALRDAGIYPRDDYFVMTKYQTAEGYAAFTGLRALPEPPTAVITYSDLLALGALRAAADLGLNVPADVSIIGFDDIELASYTVPRLSTVAQDKKLMGEMAFKQIQRRIARPDLAPEHIVLPTRLVLRESSGPAK